MRGLKIGLVAVGLAIAASAAVTGCVVLDSALTVRCIDHETQTVQLATPNDDAATQFKIDRCQLDSEACTELCALVLERAAISEALTSCDVSFGTDTVTVNAHFDRNTQNPGCQNTGGPISGEDDVAGGGVGTGSGGTFPVDAGGVFVVDAPPEKPDAPLVVPD